MNRALACLALAGFVALPRASYTQDMPQALKDSALAVRIYAIIPIVQTPGPTSPAANPSTSSSASAPNPSAPGALAPSTPAALPPWQAERVKYTVPGTPVPFKFIGTNGVIIVQVTPFSRQDDKGVELVVQGQVWVKTSDGGLSYHTSIDTL